MNVSFPSYIFSVTSGNCDHHLTFASFLRHQWHHLGPARETNDRMNERGARRTKINVTGQVEDDFRVPEVKVTNGLEDLRSYFLPAPSLLAPHFGVPVSACAIPSSHVKKAEEKYFAITSRIRKLT